VKGRRVYPDADGWLPPLQPGDYGKPNLSAEESGAHVGGDPDAAERWRDRMNRWQVCSPTGDQGAIETHTVTEHEDGTVTMRPSLDWSQRRPGGWHGWLTAGEWTSC
jgi:hypothetical protein